MRLHEDIVAILLWESSVSTALYRLGLCYAADDILDAEEVYDDAPDAGHEYADLAAAMGDEEDSAQNEDSDVGSDADKDDEMDMASDVEDDLGLSDTDDADSADDDDSGMNGLDQSDQVADSADDDALNPFELAEATDSEDDQKQKGTAVVLETSMTQSVMHWDKVSFACGRYM